MKSQMKLTVSDEPVRDVKMAQAKEAHDRTTVLGLLMNEGHVTVLNTDDPNFITLKIEDETFIETRKGFPTTVLMARLQLAIHAGKSSRNAVVQVFEDSANDNLFQHFRPYEVREFAHHKAWQQNETLAAGYDSVREITATVKPKALRKGLRP